MFHITTSLSPDEIILTSRYKCLIMRGEKIKEIFPIKSSALFEKLYSRISPKSKTPKSLNVQCKVAGPQKCPNVLILYERNVSLLKFITRDRQKSSRNDGESR